MAKGRGFISCYPASPREPDLTLSTKRVPYDDQKKIRSAAFPDGRRTDASMIKIAFVIDTIESPTAGTEKQLLMLIKHLDRSRFQPYLCVLRLSEWLEKEFDLCPLYVAGIGSFKNAFAWLKIVTLSRYFQRETVDVVQVHFRDSSIAGVLAAKLAGVKTIIGTRRNQGYWMTSLDKWIQKGLDRWVTAYIANSQSTKQWMADSEGVQPGRVEVINNGFNFSLFQLLSAEKRKMIRASLGLAEDAPVIVIVANLRPVKDHNTFLQAAGVVHRHFPEARFLVVGGGSELQKLKDVSIKLGIDSAVDFIGARLDIPEILNACDVGVLSSVSESFSNAVVEYMAAGLPVVTTDVGGAREAVDDNVNGFIVPAGDWEMMGKRLTELIESGRATHMGQESRNRSGERFSMVSMVEKTQHLYCRCLEGPKNF